MQGHTVGSGPSIGSTLETHEEPTASGVLAQNMEDFYGAKLETVHAPQDGDAATLLVVPRGKVVQDISNVIDARLPNPRRRAGTAFLYDVDSFIAHINRFWSVDKTVVFTNSDPQKPKLTAIYDYHPGISTPDAKPQWLGHRAIYRPVLSEQWKKWFAQNGASMNQTAFAEFLEERITDVVVPKLDDPDLKTFADLVQGKFAEPGELMALSRGLSISADIAVRNAVQLSSGIINIQYTEQHKDGEGNPINVPNLFTICIPVFYGDALYRIAVRLRYRLSGGKLSWSYLLVRPDVVFDHAFKELSVKVRKETSAVVMQGAPESSNTPPTE